MKLTFAIAPIELKQHTTAMVAFDMENDPLGHDLEEAHVTLLFLGEAADLESQYDAIQSTLAQFAVGGTTFTATLAGGMTPT